MHQKSPKGWLNKEETRAIIAASNTYAPQNYSFRALLYPNSPRKVRSMKIGRRLYINEGDLRSEMRRLPFYDKSNSIRNDSCCTAPYHEKLPPDEDPAKWLTIREAADTIGEKINRLQKLVARYNIKAYSYEGKLRVKLSEARAAASARTDQFIRRLGLNPKDYPIIRKVTYGKNWYYIRHAPDLIGK